MSALQESDLHRGKNVSAMTLNRDSSDEIQKSNSRVLLSRVASLEKDAHAETMRDKDLVDPYSDQILDDLSKKKALSAEHSNGLSKGPSSPDEKKYSSNEMLLQLEDPATTTKRLNDKRSSAGLQVTSLGEEESFIHPPSPIH